MIYLPPVEYLVMFLLLALYFLPLIIAAARGHHNTAPIAVINFFLGWTGLGWIAALCWSLTNR